MWGGGGCKKLKPDRSVFEDCHLLCDNGRVQGSKVKSHYCQFDFSREYIFLPAKSDSDVLFLYKVIRDL